jgi:hypothetical protein
MMKDGSKKCHRQFIATAEFQIQKTAQRGGLNDIATT